MTMNWTARVAWVTGLSWLASAGQLASQSPVLTGTEGRVPPWKEAAELSRISGTYEVRVCRRGGACVNDAGDDALDLFFVSIQSDSIPLVGIDSEAYVMLGTGSAGDRPLNACYVLGRRIRQSSSYAGISKVGLFSVRPGPATQDVKLILGASVDAFFEVTASVGDGRLEGVGRSIQVPSTATTWPTDTVIGRRIGPSDAQRCISYAHDLAVDARWAALHSRP